VLKSGSKRYVIFKMKNKEEQKKHKHPGEGKAHESNLCEAELRFRAIFEQSPNGILIIDTDGNLLEFNEAAHRQLGYTRDEFAQLRIADLDPVESPEEISAKMREVLRKGEAEFEVKHRTKEGKIRDVHVITRVVNLSGRRVFQAIWHDITERKQTEEILSKYREHLEDLVRGRTVELAAVNERLQKDVARRRRTEDKLRESEERFRRIFDDGPLGMALLSPSYKIINANKAVSRMIGYSEQEIAGRSMEDVTHPEDKEKSLELARQLLGGEIPLFQMEKRCIKKNGEIVWVNLTTTALRNEDGEVLYAICMIEDISNRQLAEKQREKLISELQKALAEIKRLQGILPICASCKKIRDDKGYWNQIETYIREHSEAEFTHGICPDCARKLYPEYYEE
jgi:PAS domain S-box-containing protein